MRDEDLKKIYAAYKSCNIDVPYTKINNLISKSHTIMDTIDANYFNIKRIPNLKTEMKNILKNINNKSKKTRSWGEEYKLGLEQIQNVQSLMKKRTYDIKINQKRISFVVVNQYRKFLSRQFPNSKMRRISKEINMSGKKFDKERRDINKKMEKAAQEKRKQIEENKEVMRQKRKFEYLLTQTELFSQFMLGKKKLDSFEKKDDEDAELSELNKKFQMAASQIKANIEEKKDSQPEINEEKGKLKQPKMLQCELKGYQITGFNWLARLYNQGINGILADDMGLGKTVQSISLLAYLAETEDIWGPFLVVTPVSTLHNWEQELKKFVPNFKVLNYWGTGPYRAQARHEIKKANVVLTSYQIAVADFKILRKTVWKYMILDEAQAIKSSASKRWTTLLEFKTKSRLLLTGTPVQNTMRELWALLHFIMPSLFDSLAEFTEWFSKGIEESAEKKKAVDKVQLEKLHAILKPFMLRRLKSDVKTELGEKTELEIYCDLSVRQKIYYQSIIDACKSFEMENVVMQLRKVCNHPDIFEKLETTTKLSMLRYDEEGKTVESGRSKLSFKVPCFMANEFNEDLERKNFIKKIIKNKLERRTQDYEVKIIEGSKLNGEWINNSKEDKCIFDLTIKDLVNNPKNEVIGNFFHRKFKQKVEKDIFDLQMIPVFTKKILSQTPHVFTNDGDYVKLNNENINFTIKNVVDVPPLNTFIIDSGKLSCLDKLLTKLKQEDHRVLVYFQMTKMMDLVEDYCVKKEYTYCRLDGSSKIAVRRDTVNDWQTGDKFIFLLSTRAGGLGINLTAADTVIFYDSDWNPTVDQQAMDRAYRIGQTKDVTVYRLITRNTIEERVIEKATNKGNLQKMVIKGKIFEGLEF
ncbi:chromatin-remodeling atpase INO80 [Vairimorpha necatrix]|uniref:Chromatin-remodeling ATPase INO80 n=1 Tax=Vairimorpha necatrix TaxID=6039 RepID=A0AAX4JAN1_9MICR